MATPFLLFFTDVIVILLFLCYNANKFLLHTAYEVNEEWLPRKEKQKKDGLKNQKRLSEKTKRRERSVTGGRN